MVLRLKIAILLQVSGMANEKEEYLSFDDEKNMTIHQLIQGLNNLTK